MENEKEENKTSAAVVPQQQIENLIFTIRGVQVMLDKDLAKLYDVTTGNLNKAVKRNIDRFPDHFMFQLNKEEWHSLKFQNEISNTNLKFQNGISSWGGSRHLPFVFTEQGVSQLSAVLHSKVAINTSIRIIDAFVSMRKFISANAGVFQRLDHMERNQILSEQRIEETNNRIDQILDRLDDGSLKQKLGIFFDGQMFDAYVLVETLFKRASRRIVLIDDYINADILQRMRVRSPLSVSIDCYVRTRSQTHDMQLAFSNYNKQYPEEHCRLHSFEKSHDRFLIIDDEVYHFGASIKDLGKRWFGVNLITELSADELITKIQDA